MNTPLNPNNARAAFDPRDDQAYAEWLKATHPALVALLDRYFDSEGDMIGAMLAAGVDASEVAPDGQLLYLYDADGWILRGQS